MFYLLLYLLDYRFALDSNDVSALVVALVASAAAGIALYLARLRRALRPARFVGACFAGLSLWFVVASFARRLWQVDALLAVAGLAAGAGPAFMSLVVRDVPLEAQGKVQGRASAPARERHRRDLRLQGGLRPHRHAPRRGHGRRARPSCSGARAGGSPRRPSSSPRSMERVDVELERLDDEAALEEPPTAAAPAPPRRRRLISRAPDINFGMPRREKRRVLEARWSPPPWLGRARSAPARARCSLQGPRPIGASCPHPDESGSRRRLRRLRPCRPGSSGSPRRRSWGWARPSSSRPRTCRRSSRSGRRARTSPRTR